MGTLTPEKRFCVTFILPEGWPGVQYVWPYGRTMAWVTEIQENRGIFMKKPMWGPLFYTLQRVQGSQLLKLYVYLLKYVYQYFPG